MRVAEGMAKRYRRGVTRPGPVVPEGAVPGPAVPEGAVSERAEPERAVPAPVASTGPGGVSEVAQYERTTESGPMTTTGCRAGLSHVRTRIRSL